jgi:threonine dehydratase
MLPDFQHLLDAHNRIRPYIHKTAVLTSHSINEMAACEVFFKCENFQRMGAFKMRGATNAILMLSDEEKKLGVTTHSSGNFAQALALAARTAGISATVIMPETAPEIKKRAVQSYGARIIECQPTLKAREETVEKFIEKSGAVFLHPYNNFEVIYGQSTAALELLVEIPDLDVIIAPVGGGGLLAGTALAAHYLKPVIKVYGGEPFGADDAYRSLQKGEIQPSLNPKTIADGLLTSLGDKTFPIIQKLVAGIIRVDEKEIAQAMRMVWERMKIIIEPSAAVSLAALLRSDSLFKNKKAGLILSGGNVDLNKLPF